MPTIGSRPWYKDWFSSSFYHKLYFEHENTESKKFINTLIEFLQPEKKSRILYSACGRGAQCVALAKMGFDVTGVDFTVLNIQDAKQFENFSGNPLFYQLDVRLPFFTNYYDYVFNLINGFGYFETRREHDDAVRTFSAALKPGGILVIDYINRRYAEDNLLHHEIK